MGVDPSLPLGSLVLHVITRHLFSTGCGKTTQVAQFLLDDQILRKNGSTCHIVCTQPRRISATSVAQRVADERDERLGQQSVGFQIRLERSLPAKQGSILFCTTGVLLQLMQSDPALCEFSHVLLDEVHERDTVCDFAITLLRDVIAKVMNPLPPSDAVREQKKIF